MPKSLPDNWTKTNPKLYAEVRSDPRQISWLGDEHEEELKEKYQKPELKSALLQDHGMKEAGLSTSQDLDRWDSKVTKDLMALHDRIHLDPSRGVVPDYWGNENAARQTYQFTSGALQNQLLPAIVQALKKLPSSAKQSAQGHVDKAVRNLSLARNAFSGHQFKGAGYYTETAFSALHQAIEIIREATRRQGKSMMPHQHETRILDVINDF